MRLLVTLAVVLAAATALPIATSNAARAGEKAVLYQESQILAFDLAGVRVGMPVEDIDKTLAAAGFTKSKLFADDGKKVSTDWEDGNSRLISTTNFVDVDGVRKAYQVSYRTKVDPETPVQAVIDKLVGKYGEPSSRTRRGLFWLVTEGQDELDPEPIMTAGGDRGELKVQIRWFGAQNAVEELEKQREKKAREEAMRVREAARQAAVEKLDLGL